MPGTSYSPLVSIIIPTYNYAGYLRTAIESCLKQSYRNLEIVVVDDGSTDNTEEIATGYGNSSIIYIRQENSGVSRARNRGLEAARGDFIAFLDADDYLTEDAMQVRLDAFLKNPDAGLVITETYSKKGEVLSCRPRLQADAVSVKFYEDLLLGRFPFGTCAALIRSDVAKRHRFPPDISNGEDVAYFAKIFFSVPVCYLMKPTAVTVWHKDSLRHNTEELKRHGLELAEIIFNDPFYGGAIEYLRKDFIANRCLEIFRKLYLFGKKKTARSYYKRALSIKPGLLFRTDYLIKFVKSLLL